MNILILNPVGRLSDGRYVCLFPSRWDCAAPHKLFSYYPIELAYLSTLLKRELKDTKVQMFDPNIREWGWLATAEQTLDYKPDIVVTECSALTYPDMTKVLGEVKHWSHAVQFWLCGPYGASNPEKAKADGWDLTFEGEYEQEVLCQLNQSMSAIPRYIDLDWLPWPEDEDISRINYYEWSNPYPGMVQLYPTRGCPLACSFCVVPSYYGGHGKSYSSHRVRDVDNVCDEIEYLAAKYEGKFNGCFFNEETHNANPEWLQTFAEKLISRGLDRFHFDAMCGYWSFSESLIALLARAGYCQIRIGIESTSQEVGKKIGKRIIPEKLWKVLEWCKAAGIAIYGTTQVGAPGSNFQSDTDTLRTMQELRARGYVRTWQNSVSTPQPGTPMYEEAKAEGRLLTEDISQYDGLNAVMEWPDYKAADINKAKAIFHP